MKTNVLMVAVLVAAIVPMMANAADIKTKYGITVLNCVHDYGLEDYCSDKTMKKLAQVMKTQDPNFADDKILYTYKGLADPNYYSVVVMDAKKKTVDTFSILFKPMAQKVNKKGDKIEFNFKKNSPILCVKGIPYRYQEMSEYLPAEMPKGACYKYVDFSNNGDYDLLYDEKVTYGK